MDTFLVVYVNAYLDGMLTCMQHMSIYLISSPQSPLKAQWGGGGGGGVLWERAKLHQTF